jgi:hypothetical protein
MTQPKIRPGDPKCPRCRGAGVTSAPYMSGLKDGNLVTITICGCTKESGA